MSEVPLQPSEWDQIVGFNRLDVYHKSPVSGERQYKSRTCNRWFDPNEELVANVGRHQKSSTFPRPGGAVCCLMPCEDRVLDGPASGEKGSKAGPSRTRFSQVEGRVGGFHLRKNINELRLAKRNLPQKCSTITCVVHWCCYVRCPKAINQYVYGVRLQV